MDSWYINVPLLNYKEHSALISFLMSAPQLSKDTDYKLEFPWNITLPIFIHAKRVDFTLFQKKNCQKNEYKLEFPWNFTPVSFFQAKQVDSALFSC